MHCTVTPELGTSTGRMESEQSVLLLPSLIWVLSVQCTSCAYRNGKKEACIPSGC